MFYSDLIFPYFIVVFLPHLWGTVKKLWHVTAVMSLVELEFESSCILTQKILYDMTTEDKLYTSCLERSNHHHSFLPN